MGLDRRLAWREQRLHQRHRRGGCESLRRWFLQFHRRHRRRQHCPLGRHSLAGIGVGHTRGQSECAVQPGDRAASHGCDPLGRNPHEPPAATDNPGSNPRHRSPRSPCSGCGREAAANTARTPRPAPHPPPRQHRATASIASTASPESSHCAGRLGSFHWHCFACSAQDHQARQRCAIMRHGRL